MGVSAVVHVFAALAAAWGKAAELIARVHGVSCCDEAAASQEYFGILHRSSRHILQNAIVIRVVFKLARRPNLLFNIIRQKGL